MDKIDLRTLRILEAIGDNEQVSQRGLAVKLGVSLGLVNSFVKRLANKGYFKIVSTPKKRFKYVLTPQGFAEKSRLSYKYITHSYQFYREARHNVRKRLLALESQEIRRIAFYGITDFAEIAYISLQETRLELVAVADEPPAEKPFFVYPVMPVNRLTSFSPDTILITDIVNLDHKFQDLIDLGIPKTQIALP